MRYVGDLISDSRTDTNNTDFSATNGIQTADFLRYLNYAQESLQSLILRNAPDTFQDECILNIVADQEAYTPTGPVYMGERIVNVEFSYDGTVRNYVKIYEASISNRNSRPQGWLVNYIRRSGQILLRPPRNTSSGALRITFEREFDKLDIRRGSVSGTPSGSSVTVSGEDTTALTAAINTNYVCINNFNGTPMLYNAPIANYNSGTHVITVTGNVSDYLVTGYALADLANGYITIGQYSTTHSKLKNHCERYLVAYTNWKVLGRDAATTAKAKQFADELILIQKDIIEGYQVPDKDEREISIENDELLLMGI